MEPLRGVKLIFRPNRVLAHHHHHNNNNLANNNNDDDDDDDDNTNLATRLYHHKIIKDGTSPHCRLCNRYDESIDHSLSGCPELAKTEYIKRHNNAAAYMH